VNEILTELKLEREDIPPFRILDPWERALREKVWQKFYELRDKGAFKKRIWVISVDFSGDIAKLLTDWFGPDPRGGR
jgi:hypothetical protein